VLAEVMQALPEGARLRGICVTGMLPAVVLLDADGQLLRPSIQQSDGRVAVEVEELRAEVDEAAFLHRTGNGINQQLVAAKLRWIAKHEPDVFARIDKVCGSYDYIAMRLTGGLRVEQNWALEAGFTDLSRRTIDPDLVALAGLPAGALPEIAVSHEVIGHVTPQAAAETGLPEGLPVMGGAADHIASALAAGIAQAGDVLLKFGGAGDVVVATDTARPDARLYMDYHLVPGLYAPNGCMAASGAALNWLAAMLDGQDGPHPRLDALAATVPAGADGVLCLPYFLGEKTPIHDPLARGTFTGLGLNHTRGHLWRALLESVAYAFRHHLEVLEEIGHHPRRLFASDGGSASRVWMQIMADVAGRPVQVLGNAHGSCAGAAWVAAVAAGTADWAEITTLVAYGELFEPDPVAKAVHDAGYRDFRALYEALKPFFHREASTA